MKTVQVCMLAVLAVTSTAVADNVLSINKGVIVHLFEWKYADIAKECEEFLAPYGFSGVQISPPSENVIVSDPKRPWWERYQPISYKLVTRSGSEEDLQDMLDRCNRVGVKIFADVVLNHMTGPGKALVGTGGSTADADAYSYPAVPFTDQDFHAPHCALNNYNDAQQVRNCELVGLRDLNNTRENVVQKQVEYLNKLVEMGIAGFRVDAAKHMWPEDLKNILGRLKHLSKERGFPANTKPMIYQEVIDMRGEAVKYQDYQSLGMVTDFRYGNELGRSFQGLSDLVYLKNFGAAWDLLPDDVGIVFIENHDTQRDTNTNILNYKKFRPYKMAVAFMLSYPYGTPKLLSSYYFYTFNQGPPHDSEYHTQSPQPIKDNVCSNGWVCEHRWRQHYNMVRFHNVVKGTAVTNWWDNGKNQISFCRGNKGFVAFNKESSTALDRKLQTCLPKGTYCDVISGSLVKNVCTGKTVAVGEDGLGQVNIAAFDLYQTDVNSDGVVALHVQARVLDSNKSPEQRSDKKCEASPTPIPAQPCPVCHCPAPTAESKVPSASATAKATTTCDKLASFVSGIIKKVTG